MGIFSRAETKSGDFPLTFFETASYTVVPFMIDENSDALCQNEAEEGLHERDGRP